MKNIDTTCFCAAIGMCVLAILGGVVPAALGGGSGVVASSEYNELLGAGGLRFDFIPNKNGLPTVHVIGNVIETGDMNNDGIIDLFFGFEDFNNNIQYALGEMQADGSIGFELHSYNTLGVYETATTCDIDGNGSADFVVRDSGTDAIWVHYIENDEITQIDYLDHFNMIYHSDSPDGYIDARTTVRGRDLDGDGLADLVMNTLEDLIVVRWSSRPAEVAFESYMVPQLITHNVLYPLDDYDGDGLLDVLLLDLESEMFLLLSGTGSDSLMIPRDLQVPVSGHVDHIAYPVFGRFDANPALDLVVYDAGLMSWVIVPNFAIGVDPVVAFGLGADERVVETPGDVDLSGFDDLLIVGDDPLSNTPGEIEEVSLLLDPLSWNTERIVMETGNTPDAEMLVDSGRPRLPRCIAINLDADPENELLWLNDWTKHKDQDGVFGEYESGYMLRASEQRDESDMIPWIGATQIEGQKNPLHMLPIDLDGDGVDELFMVGTGTKGRIVDVDAGTFANVPGVNDGFMSVAADLGGDGSPEIVVSRVQNSLAVLPVVGDGTTGPRVLFANPNGNDYRGIVSADFNNDGKDDIAAVAASGEIHLWQGIGDAQITLASVLSISGTWTVMPGVIDINMDGYKDLVIGEGNGFRFYINQQDGTFVVGDMLSAPVEPYWIIIEDMDQDGNADIISVDRNLAGLGDGISVHYLDEAGGEISVRYLFYLHDDPVSEVVAADFNGDGLLDLVGSVGSNTGDPSENKHLVWAQVPGRDFEVHAVLPASESATVGMSDFNQDGAMDVVTASDLDDSVRVHWGTPVRCPADIDGDGELDFFDVSAFLSANMDFDGDGVFDFFDVSAFLRAFLAGCP